MIDDPDNLAELLADLVTAGGEVVMDYRDQLLRGDDLAVHKKSSHADLVTNADLASEQVMLDLLERHRPEDAIISEERGLVGSDSEFTWVLDPLDGTANFTRGSENFGVIAGLLQGTTPVAGAMFLPTIDALYVAVAGCGAHRNGVVITRDGPPPLGDAMIDHSLLHFADAAMSEDQRRTLNAVLAAARGVRCDHSVRYMADTVDGVLDGFVYHSLGLWDIVGTTAILSEVGVTVTDLAGAPLDLSPQRWKRGRLYPAVGAASPLHGSLIEVLANR